MAKRYINYDELLETRHRLGLDEMSKIHKVNAFNQFIDNLPTADVVEVVRGEWIDKYKGKYANPLYVCSVCGKKALYEMYSDELQQTKTRQALSNGCPHCLAKMGGGEAE